MQSSSSTFSSKKVFSYENGILLLLGFTFGLIFFDRNALGFLTPFIIREIELSQAQLGWFGSALAVAWALSAYIVSSWSDQRESRKPFLLASIIIFSICSAGTGLAQGFLFILLTRILMGIAEGPFLPLSLAVMNAESTPSRRGVNAGLLQTLFAALLGTTVAPILLVYLANLFGWRVAFFLTGIPGLICAFLVWKFMREPKFTKPQTETTQTQKSVLESLLVVIKSLSMLKQRNILVCSIISIFMVSWFLVSLIFLSVFLTGFRGFSEQEIWVIAPMGFSTVLFGFLGTAISDRIGRKPVLIIFNFLGIITALTALYFSGPLWLMAVLFFIGWSASGVFPLFMGVVPGESVSPTLAATSMGLVVFVGEIVGGFVAPPLTGWIADQSSMAALMIAVGICAFGGGIASLFLKETAPRKVGQA